MKKKLLLLLLAISLMVAADLSLTSCGDDPIQPSGNTGGGGNTGGEENTGGGGNTENHVWPKWKDTDGNNVILLSIAMNYSFGQISNHYFGYSETDRFTSFGSNYGTYPITWSGNTVFTFSETYEEEDGEVWNFRVTLGNNGLIDIIEYTCRDNDGYSEEGTLTCAYNTGKRLISTTTTCNYTEDGVTGDTKDVETYNWTNGNLTNYRYTYQENSYENGQTETENEAGSIAITYGQRLNPTLQFPYGLAYELDTDFEGFMALGLFGAGPQYLPVTSKFNDSSVEEEYEYTLNDNGTIASETQTNTWMSVVITYTYGQSADKGDSGKGGLGNDDFDKYKKITGKTMLRHIGRRHKATRKG